MKQKLHLVGLVCTGMVISASAADAKAKLEARIAEVRSEHKRCSARPHEAWELTKEALAF